MALARSGQAGTLQGARRNRRPHARAGQDRALRPRRAAEA